MLIRLAHAVALVASAGWGLNGAYAQSPSQAAAQSQPLPAQLSDEELLQLAHADAEAAGETTEGADETIEIAAEAPAEPAETRLRAAETAHLPGVGGDALRVVQMLPGVARPGAGSAELTIWGASPQDTRIAVDGVPVPWLYHRGGWRSILPTTAVDTISLVPAGFGVGAGQAIGGLIDITTTATSDSVLSADFLDGEVTLATTRRRLSSQAYGRASWLRDVVELVEPEALRAGLVPYPTWWDAGGAVVLEKERTQFSLRVLAAGDRVARPLQLVGENDKAAETSQRSFIRVIAGWSERGEHGTTRWRLWGGRDHEARLQQLAQRRSGWTIDTTSVGVTGQRIARLGEQLLTAGLEGEWFSDELVRQGSLSNPAREGDPYIYGQPLGADYAYDEWQTTTAAVAPWVRLDYVKRGLTLSPGVRLDGYVLGASRLNPRVGATPQIGWQTIEFAASPRLDARWRIGGTTLALQGGRYLQPRKAIDTSATFGTPTLTLERAWHAVGSVKVRESDDALVVPELAIWTRWLEDLIVRDVAPAPQLGKALTQAGAGTAAGMQVVTKLRGRRLWGGAMTGWLSYNYTHSERRAYEQTRKVDRDQPHVFAVAASYARSAWIASARFRAASGDVRTPVAGRYYDASIGAYAPIAGAVNTLRLPAFAQLDLRVERSLAFGEATVSVALDLQNVLGRDNAEEYIYDAGWQSRDVIVGAPRLVWLQVKVAMPTPKRSGRD